MTRTLLCALAALAVAAWLVAPVDAQKGKGGGKGGGGKGGGPPAGRGGNNSAPPARSGGSFTPSGPGNSEPARSFTHPRSGNDLSQEVRDKLPPGLRDKPADHPGVANHLRKQGLTDQDPIPAELRNQLPPGLRDRPYTHPGVANHLGKLGWTIDDEGNLVRPVDPIPADVRRQLPPALRDQPYDHPGVANQLGRMGWTFADDGTLIPPRNYYSPEPFPEFRPFGGFFRRW